MPHQTPFSVGEFDQLHFGGREHGEQMAGFLRRRLAFAGGLDGAGLLLRVGAQLEEFLHAGRLLLLWLRRGWNWAAAGDAAAGSKIAADGASSARRKRIDQIPPDRAALPYSKAGQGFITSLRMRREGGGTDALPPPARSRVLAATGHAARTNSAPPASMSTSP